MHAKMILCGEMTPDQSNCYNSIGPGGMCPLAQIGDNLLPFPLT